MANPKPNQTFRALMRECAITESHTGRINCPDLFKANRGMPEIGLEEFKVLISQQPNSFRQLAVMEPEFRVSVLLQSGVQRPASK